MEVLCRRLRRGDDLLLEIERLAREESIAAGVVLSAVGCVSRAVLRDASGVTVRAVRCHLHLALSKEDLSTVGGHLMPGCIINTTCELVLARLDGWRFGVEQDAQTGYDELVFHRTGTEEAP